MREDDLLGAAHEQSPGMGLSAIGAATTAACSWLYYFIGV